MSASAKACRLFIIAAVSVIVAFGCRRVVVYLDNATLEILLNYIRTFIYIGLYCAWGISVSRRVVQSQSRRLLAAVSILMIFWFVLREVKYRFVLDDNVMRFFWYLYYIPLLTIPLLAFAVSLTLGKSEDYRLPWRTSILFVITTVLILLVLTNDLHQLVFRFPENAAVKTEFNRKLGAFYYVLTAWGALCTVGAFVVMVRKCRIPQSKKFLWLPLLPFFAAIIYFALYAANFPVVKEYLSDFAAVCCLLFLCFFESCIRCGLIQSNSRYSDLFSASSNLAVQITDGDYNVIYSARSAELLPKQTLKSAEKAPVLLGSGHRLMNMPVCGGRAVWTEDISELLKLRETLLDRREELRERNALLRREYDMERQHRTVEEQNRLYDLLQLKTQPQLDRIDSLVRKYGETDDADKKLSILAQIAVLGSYVKRSKDFVLSADEAPLITQGKLEAAFGESFRSLVFLNIRGSYLVNIGREFVPGKILMLAYDFFEDVLEAVFDSACYINVRVSGICGKLRINILTDSTSGARPKNFPGALILREDDGTAFVLDLEGGGGE